MHLWSRKYRYEPTDPNETAKDMTDRYKNECATLKVRLIAKLLEQLEVKPKLICLCAKFHWNASRCCHSGWTTPTRQLTHWTSKVSPLCELQAACCLTHTHLVWHAPISWYLGQIEGPRALPPSASPPPSVVLQLQGIACTSHKLYCSAGLVSSVHCCHCSNLSSANFLLSNSKGESLVST